jgi:hypothetical protein
MTHQTLSIRFPKAPYKTPEELRRLVNSLPNGSHPLLHNHRENDMDYPLVQYREIAGKPAIWAIDEGIDAVLDILDQLPAAFKTKTGQEEDFSPGKNMNLFKYKCESFLPFNEDNYGKWKADWSLKKRVDLVEGIMKDHVLNFYQYLGAEMYSRDINLFLQTLDRKPSVELHGSGQSMKFLCFETIFFTDLSLPVGLGLGKAKAKGYGITLPM